MTRSKTKSMNIPQTFNKLNEWLLTGYKIVPTLHRSAWFSYGGDDQVVYETRPNFRELAERMSEDGALSATQNEELNQRFDAYFSKRDRTEDESRTVISACGIGMIMIGKMGKNHTQKDCPIKQERMLLENMSLKLVLNATENKHLNRWLSEHYDQLIEFCASFYQVKVDPLNYPFKGSGLDYFRFMCNTHPKTLIYLISYWVMYGFATVEEISQLFQYCMALAENEQNIKNNQSHDIAIQYIPSQPKIIEDYYRYVQQWYAEQCTVSVRPVRLSRNGEILTQYTSNGEILEITEIDPCIGIEIETQTYHNVSELILYEPENTL